MAELRVIAAPCHRAERSGFLAGALGLLAIGAAACRSSEAGPTSGLTPPTGWQPLPQLASAASDAAKQARITVDGVEAWGEPARGCYAAWFAVRGGGGAPDVMADQLVRGMTVDPALFGILVRDVIKPAKGAKTGVLSLGFDRGAYRGRLRANLSNDGKLAALACFWNMREPIACEQACVGLLGSMR